MREVQKLCQNLSQHAKTASLHPELTGAIQELIREEIELAEICVAAKEKTTPRTTRLLFREALKRQLPLEVKILLG